MSSNCDNKKYIVTETREPTEKIPSYQLPTDSGNNRMSGFRIIKSDKEDGYEPYNDW